MSGYFSVEFDAKGNINDVRDYLFLFKSPGHLYTSDLADTINESLRKAFLPDALVIVCLGSEYNNVLEALQSDSDIQRALRRAKTIVTVALCSLSIDGKIDEVEYVRNRRAQLPLITNGDPEPVFRSGLAKLFSKSNIVIESPSGFIFVKPSKKKSTFFLRAEEALIESEHVDFVAYALLPAINKRHIETAESIDTIYIDSMAISSIAYAARELYSSLYKSPKPRIVSFHSYDGMRDVRIPRIRTSLCLISASSSMSMHNRWRELTNCLPTEVVTLVTLKSADHSDQALYQLDWHPSPKMPTNASSLKDLKIFGERFSQEDTPTKRVLLREKVHK